MHGVGHLRLDEGEPERHRVLELLLVDERRHVGRQVVLVVREVQDGHRRDLVLGEPVRVDASGRRAGDELVPVEQSERARRLGRALEQRRRRREEVQLLAERDAVEVHHAGDLLELAAELRLVGVVTRAGQLDLLRGKRDEADAALEVAAGERFADPAHAFDARRVVDRARPAPHGVVVRADDDVAVARGPGMSAITLRSSRPGTKRPPTRRRTRIPSSRRSAVGSRDECGRRRRDVHVARHERDRAEREGARQKARARRARSHRRPRSSAGARRRPAHGYARSASSSPSPSKSCAYMHGPAAQRSPSTSRSGSSAS